MSQRPARLKVALIQNNAGLNADANVSVLEQLIEQAATGGADLIATAEYCSHYGMIDGRLAVGSAPLSNHAGVGAFRSIAQQVERHILAGSFGIKTADGRTRNTSMLFSPEGAIIARYEKIHLFDVDLDDGESYRESADIAAGDRAVLADLELTNRHVATLGLSICYDLRFAHLYRDLAKAGAEILTIPAAFTAKTGKAHWHTLVRARAIETGCFVIAPSQCGTDPDGRLKRYGHSLIVSPWGDILADGGESEGIVVADLELSQVSRIRRMVPALQHDRGYHVSNTDMARAAE